jgi:N-acetyl-gamma-glutamyl-phosphate reductase
MAQAETDDGKLPMISVAIVGASGYGARELLNILLRHPGAKVTVATSRQEETPRLDALHPTLTSRTDLRCEPFDAERIAERASVAFLGLPHVASMQAAQALRKLGVKVIDLSADYRLKDSSVYRDWYEHTHTDPEGLAEAVYGLPELYREQIADASLIANPGCYTSASILGLAPLIAEHLIDRRDIIIDAKSGVSGGGRAPKLSFHFPECNESITAYGVGRHRHTPEINQVLSDVGRASGEAVDVIFTPHLVPMDRGILATIYAMPRGPVSEHDLMDLYRSYYRGSPFIRLVDRLPATKDTAYTNYCDITIRIVRGRILILSALDNLLKGAAGVAVQNFNLMFGYAETEALI